MGKEMSATANLFEGFYILKNVLVSFLATAILLFLGAIAVTYLSVSEATIDVVVLSLTAICVGWGGFRASRHMGRQGLLSGVISGLVYMTFLYVIGAIIFGEFALSPDILRSVLIGAGCGGIGGVIGVNTKKRRRK
ncbi:MAG: TIGR04086 family membrane protein [Clostridia bacterium]|nr:TIGR04086 family membrane protein [Clostridia bacterium]